MNWRKWLDECALSGRGILLATREKRFYAGFVPAFIVFAMLINLLSGGFAKFELMWATGFSGTMKILGDAFLSIFPVGQAFSDWIYMFAIAMLQAVLIGLIVLLWHKKRQGESRNNAANVERAGIITGLIALGAGCPTCGTTLLTPLIGAIFSSGGLAVTGAVSTVLTVIAVVVAILSLRRLGLEAYVIIVNEKYLKKKREKEENEKSR